MKKLFMPALLALGLAIFPVSLGRAESEAPEVPVLPSRSEAALRAIQMSYPDLSFDVIREGDIFYLVPENGPRVVLDDGLIRHGQDLPNNPSLVNTFEPLYAPGQAGRWPEADYDPSRARNLDFLKALYGADQGEVEAGLTRVDFFGQKRTLQLPAGRGRGPGPGGRPAGSLSGGTPGRPRLGLSSAGRLSLAGRQPDQPPVRPCLRHCH